MTPKTTKQQIEIAGVKILLTQKRIRNLHLRICSPDGEVRVSAPLLYSFAQVREFVLQKIEWIKKGQNQIRNLLDEGKIRMPSKFVSGEGHYFFGEKFRLEVIKNSSKNEVMLSLSKHDLQGPKSPFDKLRVTSSLDENVIKLHVKGQSNFKQREKLLDDFYRKNLKEIIPQLIAKYEEKMNVKVAEFGVKKMKTRWGTCNVRARRIWLSLELAKKSIKHLESTVVHEMVHLLERKHSKRFYNLMDQFMPEWRNLEAKAID
ncbi:MAG: M48 family metallopeptidase [Proteobacteria bacterium]|nr:M48 family metallopeptidase [Pseudomonadota bacterium]